MCKRTKQQYITVHSTNENALFLVYIFERFIKNHSFITMYSNIEYYRKYINKYFNIAE